MAAPSSTAPINAAVVDLKTGLLTQVWRAWLQNPNAPLGGIQQLTGSVTATGPGIVAATITDHSVTYAKIQTVTASRLLGRGSAAGTGDVQELTAGTGLQINGTVLQATGGGGSGVPGLDGDEGPMGPPGVPGPIGATGATGPAGAGGQSLIGPPGVDGDDGEPGPPGPLGLTGATGATGSTGATGATGPAGVGLPGLDGEDGDSLILGASIATPITGPSALGVTTAITTAPVAMATSADQQVLVRRSSVLGFTAEQSIGYWSVLTNGDGTSPAVIFDSFGDTIAVWTAL